VSQPNQSSSKLPVDPGFAPNDITDRRELFEWKSRWPKEAWIWIFFDALYLFLCFGIGIGAYVHQILRYLPQENPMGLCSFLTITASAGVVGGASFSGKWFIHVVAKGLWHQDRVFWRIFSPLISAILSTILCLIFFQNDLAEESKLGVGFLIKITTTSFMAGHFSDSALAKLAEIAKVLFGPTAGLGEPTKKPGPTGNAG
jgi:hypothetical protein